MADDETQTDSLNCSFEQDGTPTFDSDPNAAIPEVSSGEAAGADPAESRDADDGKDAVQAAALKSQGNKYLNIF